MLTPLPTTEILETAAVHATRDVPIAAPRERVDDVLARIRGRRFTCAAVVAVCDGSRLAGAITIESLFAAAADAVVGDIMDVHPPTVAGHRD
ncbi:hypothetical protein [Nocardia thraciensis]